MGTNSLRKAVGDNLPAKVEWRCEGTDVLSRNVFRVCLPDSQQHTQPCFLDRGAKAVYLGPVCSSFFCPTSFPIALNSPAKANRLQGFQWILLVLD